ncbi:hypothetical protein L208DRAFT_1388747, partial [Tricholoma matsutake]
MSFAFVDMVSTGFFIVPTPSSMTSVVIFNHWHLLVDLLHGQRDLLSRESL